MTALKILGVMESLGDSVSTMGALHVRQAGGTGNAVLCSVAENQSCSEANCGGRHL